MAGLRPWLVWVHGLSASMAGLGPWLVCVHGWSASMAGLGSWLVFVRTVNNQQLFDQRLGLAN